MCVETLTLSLSLSLFFSLFPFLFPFLTSLTLLFLSIPSQPSLWTNPFDSVPSFPTLQSSSLDTPLFFSFFFFFFLFFFFLFFFFFFFFSSFFSFPFVCWTVVSGCSRTNISWRGVAVAVLEPESTNSPFHLTPLL